MRDTTHLNSMKTTRRRFLKTTGAAGAAIGFPTVIPSSALGNSEKPAPSNRIVMGGIGIGNMGRGDHNGFLNHSDVQYVAVCDVRKGAMNGAKDKTNKKYGNSDCKAYGDYRELIARDDVDAVHIATPDHWHALQIIDACRAGKDVFCQKPETRTLREGPLMIEAARRYSRVVSGGSQRVLGDYRKIVDPCWGGELGEIKSINVNVGPLSQPCYLTAEDQPEDIDWDMWLGPAPWAPYNKARCDGNFATNPAIRIRISPQRIATRCRVSDRHHERGHSRRGGTGDPVQHPGHARCLYDDVGWLSHGPAGTGKKGAKGGASVLGFG